MFVEVFKQYKDSAWIMKPVGSAQGKGIFLFSKLSDIIEWKKDTRYKVRQSTSPPQPPWYLVYF